MLSTSSLSQALALQITEDKKCRLGWECSSALGSLPALLQEDGNGDEGRSAVNMLRKRLYYANPRETDVVYVNDL